MKRPQNYNKHGQYDPAVARVWTEYEDLSKPYVGLIDKKVYGELTPIGIRNPIRNLEWDLLFFEDSSVFSPAANYFNEVKKEKGKGEYCPYMKGTANYRSWWIEEKRRCLEGYEVGGVWIPGEYYFYLNYCIIQRIIDEKTGEYDETFPLFLSMDYYWFLELDKNENPDSAIDKKNMIMSKARRKGFSFKNAAGCCWKFFFFPRSTTIIAAELVEKAVNTFEMCLAIVDFINQYTEFLTPVDVRTTTKIISGVEVKVNGKVFKKGRRSTIMIVSLHNKPHAAAGKGVVRVIFEEAGEIKKLKKAWKFTEPTLRSGAIKKGIAIVYGTGGHMDGATRDFAAMMSKPFANGFAKYTSIYDYDQVPVESGLFIDDLWFREGAFVTLMDGSKHYAMDRNGNATRWVAELDLNLYRSIEIEAGKESYDIALTQYCKTLSEAFLVTKGSVFPATEVMERINVIKRNTAGLKPYIHGLLVESEGVIKFKPDLENVLKPMDMPIEGDENMADLTGCIMQYYAPQKINGKVPDDAYIIGHDPYAVEGSVHINSSTSLGVAYVMRTNKFIREMGLPGVIVASYIGREMRSDDYNYNLYKLAKYYNAKIMFENNRGQVKQYFQHKKSLHMLCSPPGHVIDKHITNSTSISRKFGFTTSSRQFKEELVRYVIDHVLSHSLEGEGMIMLDTIQDEGLLQEFLRFNFEHGNYDRVMAYIGCVLYLENDKIDEATKPTTNTYSFLTNNPYLFKTHNFYGTHFKA